MKTSPHLTPDPCRRPHPARLCTTGLLALLCLAGAQAWATTLAYWRFEPSDLTLDSSGNGNTLTMSNVVSSTDVAPNASGSSGSAFFNGSNAGAATVSTLSLSNYPGLTFECFVKTNGQSTLGMVYEHSTNNNNALGGFYVDFNEPAGSIRACQGPPPYGYKYYTYPTGSGWHHYAVTIDESGPAVQINVYVDGVLRTTGTTNASFSRLLGDYPFFIGARNGSQFRFNGYVDEIRISSRVLPPSGFLIAAPPVNAAIGITQQPTDVTVVANHPAAFSVKANLTNADPALLEYQWRTNGVDVPGATGSSYTLAVPPPAYEGVQVSVVVSVQSIGGIAPVTSANATLHLTPDTTPPTATVAFAQATTTVGMLFNEVLDPVSANDPTSYSLDGGVMVYSAQLLSDSKTVVLSVSELTAPTYTVSYSVADLAGNWTTNSISVTNMGFTAINIGTTPPGLLITTNAGGFTVIGGGQDIWGTADGFHFVYKQLTGDFDMRLRINNIVPNYSASSATSVRGGLMVREDTTPQSRNIYMATYGVANNTWVSTLRNVSGGTTIINKGTPLPGRGAGFSFPNVWVRLKRSGQTFTAYYSTNNLDWTQYGTNVTVSPAYPDTVMVGIGSDSVSTTGTGTFQYSDYTQFFLTNGSISITTQPTNTTVLAYRPVTFTAAALLQGNPDQSLLTYQWLSNGAPIEGANSTNFTLALPTTSDSGTQFRCVVAAPGVAPVTSAAAILTVTPDGIPPVVLGIYSEESHAVQIQFDELLDPNTANNPWVYSVDGGFNVLSAQLQPDGRSVLLTTDGLNAPVFNVTFNGVTDLSGNALNTTIAGANAGLTMLDINNGLLMPSQITAVTSNGFTVSAVGTDIFHTQDSFNFVYEWLTNDFDLRVQFVNSSPLQNGSQRGGLMVRQDASQGSPNVFVGTYAPGSGNNFWVVTERSMQDAEAVIVARPAREAAFAFPNAWLRLKRAGQQLSAYESLDGYYWTQLGTNITDLVLADGVMVGIASCPISTLPTEFQYANFGSTLPLPQLQIQAAGANAVISWTTNSTGFALQQSDSVPAGLWTAVTNAPVPAGELKQVTLPLTSGPKFYRLMR